MLQNHLQDYVGPMIMGGDFNCTLAPQLDRSFVYPPGRHDSLALRRLLGRSHLSGVLDEDMERAKTTGPLRVFMRQHTFIFTLCQVVARPVHVSNRCYVTARHSDWIRDVDCSVPDPAADHNGIIVRIGTPHRVVRIRKPRRVYPVP